jgi:REP element-mobilizing transposase RayT
VQQSGTLGKRNTRFPVAESDEQPMPQSLVKILVHVVFSTKNRADLILPEIENDLYGYIHGIVENNGAKLIIANGTANHSHLLVSLGRNDISVLIGDIKRDSSSWIKKRGVHNFYWQKGYGAFSIGQSQVPAVSRYIRDQKEHHKKQSFEDEFRGLCRKYGVEIDERYVWD